MALSDRGLHAYVQRQQSWRADGMRNLQSVVADEMAPAVRLAAIESGLGTFRGAARVLPTPMAWPTGSSCGSWTKIRTQTPSPGRARLSHSMTVTAAIRRFLLVPTLMFPGIATVLWLLPGSAAAIRGTC